MIKENIKDSLHPLLGKRRMKLSFVVCVWEVMENLSYIIWYDAHRCYFNDTYICFILRTGKQHDADRKEKLLSHEQRLSSDCQSPPQGTRLSKDFLLVISYSDMCKRGHTTLLEYEGKKTHESRWSVSSRRKKKSTQQRSWCQKTSVHSTMSSQTTGNKRRQFTTTYF